METGNRMGKTYFQGTIFVYGRKCEPTFGFLILNRQIHENFTKFMKSSTNLIHPVTKDIKLQGKTLFLFLTDLGRLFDSSVS